MKLADRKHYRQGLVLDFMPPPRVDNAEGGVFFQSGFMALNLLELKAKACLFKSSEELSPSKRHPGDMVAGLFFGRLVARWLAEVWNKP